jgi:hypothetical protein
MVLTFREKTMATTSKKHRARIAKLLSDPRYWNKSHPEHSQIFADSQRAFRDAYPEPSQDGQTEPGTVHVRAYTRTRDGKEIEVSAYDRRQDIAFHTFGLERRRLPEYLQDIAEGPIHRREKADIVQHLRAHGDIVETEIGLMSIDGVPTRVDILGKSPEGFLYVIEIKTPAYDKFSLAQQFVFPLLELGKHAFSTSPRIRLFGFEPGELLPPICVHGVYKAPGRKRAVIPLSDDPQCQPNSYRTR